MSFFLQKTQRLTVNLPRNQKFVTRVNPKATLADIFKMVCVEKNMDPYKYDLRHPTHPDEALNMASPLADYGINEIFVIGVGGKSTLDHLGEVCFQVPCKYGGGVNENVKTCSQFFLKAETLTDHCTATCGKQSTFYNPFPFIFLLLKNQIINIELDKIFEISLQIGGIRRVLEYGVFCSKQEKG